MQLASHYIISYYLYTILHPNETIYERSQIQKSKTPNKKNQNLSTPLHTLLISTQYINISPIIWNGVG